MVHKEIKLPCIPASKTAILDPSTWPEDGISEAMLSMGLATFNRHFVWLTGLSKATVAEIEYAPGTDRVKNIVQTPKSEWIQKYEACRVLVPDGKKPDVLRPESVAKKWALMTKKTTMMRIDFLATAEERAANPKILSCFNGLSFDYMQPIDFDTCDQHSGVGCVLDHFLRILANGCLDRYEYIIGYHAYAMQNYSKVGVSLAFIGRPGTGKSTLYYPSTHNKPVFKYLYEDTYQGAASISEITARFNSTCEAKLLCVCDEVGDGEGKRHMDKIKLLADAEETLLENKHSDAQRIKDKRNFIYLSNHLEAFGVDAHDEFTRKILISEVNDVYSTPNCNASASIEAEADRYFTDLNAAMASRETQAHLFWFLKQYDLRLHGWSPYGFKATELMQRLYDEANVVKAFVRALPDGICDGVQLPGKEPFQFDPSTQGESDSERCRFLLTKELHLLFKAWAARFAPSAEAMSPRTFELKMSNAAHDLGEKVLKHHHSVHGNGYIVLALVAVEDHETDNGSSSESTYRT